jgi:hypothetical protein
MSTGRDPFTFTIVEHIGVIDTNESNWNFEANIVRCCDGPEKLDLRYWSADHQRMQRGLTCTKEQALKLAQLLGDRFL